VARDALTDSHNRPGRVASAASLAALVLCLTVVHAPAADWPTWRGDPGRTAATDTELPDTLHLQYTLQLPPRRGAWPNDTQARVDASYEPVVAGDTVLVGLETPGGVLAVDAATGETRWQARTDGAVRYAPLVVGGQAVVGDDYGRVTAFDLATGEQAWQTDLNDAPDRILFAGRFASTRRITAAPVFAAGRVFVVAGGFPAYGTRLVELAPDTGAIERDVTHRGLTVWGYPAVVGVRVYLPQGHGHPHVYDAEAGRLAPAPRSDPGNPYHATVAATADFYIAGARVFPVDDPGGKAGGVTCYANATHGIRAYLPVIDGERLYGINDGILRRYTVGDDGRPIASDAYWAVYRPLHEWTDGVGEQLPLPDGVELDREQYPRRVFAKAGDTVLAGGKGAVYGIRWPADAEPTITWVGTLEDDEMVERVLVAAGRVFVVTDAGRLYAFGGGAAADPVAGEPDAPADDGPPEDGDARFLATLMPERGGRALVLGTLDPRRLGGLARLADAGLVVGVAGGDRDMIALESPRAASLPSPVQLVRDDAAAVVPPAYAFDLIAATLPIGVDRLGPLVNALTPGRGRLVLAGLEPDAVRAEASRLRLPVASVELMSNGRAIVVTRAPLPKPGPDPKAIAAAVVARGAGKFGPPPLTPSEQRQRLLDAAAEAVEAGELDDAREPLGVLMAEHPGTPEAAEAKRRLGRVELVAARRLIDAGKKDDARRKLDTLIGAHADTPIATEAEAMIEELDSDIDGLLDGF